MSPDWESVKRQLQGGDYEAAWQELRAYLDGLLRPRNLGHDPESMVLDVLHEVIVTLIRFKRSGYLERIKHLNSYCATIAIRNHRRRMSEGRSALAAAGDLASEECDAAPGPLEMLTEAELRHEIRDAIYSLHGAQQEVFLLHSSQGMNVPEICKHLQREGRPRSKQSVSALLKRARETLRKLLYEKVLRAE